MDTLIATGFDSLLSFLLLYKYIALFCIGFLGAFALPIPASTTLVAAGAFASLGYFDLKYVLMTAFIANILGDLSGYFLARRYGVRVFNSIGLGSVLRSKFFKKIEAYVRSFPQTVIFVTRFMTEVGPVTSIVSGLGRVRVRTFVAFALLGEIAYVLLYGLTGFYLGGEWENNTSFLIKAVMVVISFGVTINVIQWSLHRRHISTKIIPD